MRFFRFLVVTLILGIIQVTLLDHLRIFGIKPDLLLVTVVIAGIFFDTRLAIIFGMLTGAYKDVFSVGAFGLDVITFSLWGFLSARISRKISIDDSLTRVFLVFAVALLQNIASSLNLSLAGSFVPFGIFLRVAFLGSLYTALTLPLIVKTLKINT